MGFLDRFRIKKRKQPAITVGGIELVLIPPGEFTMGSDTGREDEKPLHEVDLDARYLHVGKYPITNAQYKRFVDATRHQAPRHWSGGSIPEGKEDHPVVWVSWDDARAYCRWLANETGQAVRLPTEAEWEKAARGTDGREYPWGDKFDKRKCNSQESGIEDTTPVGKYSRQGDSPYGVADMAGNVWEWTSSLYQDYPYDADDGREDPEAEGSRVARGGAFYNPHGGVRCTFRLGAKPYGRNVDLGFRIVLISKFLASGTGRVD